MEERLHVAAMHLDLSHEEFIVQAIEIALNKHEGKHGGIMTVQASDKAPHGVAPDQIGQDEKRELKNKRR